MSTLALGAADSGRHVEIAQGSTVTVRLPENPTTGYLWTVVGDSAPALVSKGFDAAAGAAAGAGGERSLVFEATTPGLSRLALLRKRPWLDDASADARFEIELRVVPSA